MLHVGGGGRWLDHIRRCTDRQGSRNFTASIVKSSRSYSLLVAVALLVATAVVSVNGLWRGADGDGWKQTIRSDAKGYYGYLQALFIRNDLGHEPFAAEYIKYTPEGRTLNKYFSGTSVMMAPWFAVGHWLALKDPEAPRDGTSAYEQKAISVGGWFYLFVGLLVLRALLNGLGVREAVVAWLLVVLALGTPLLQYAALQPGWSHVYSFALVSLFMLAVLRMSRETSALWTIIAAVSLALVVLIRPVNAMVVLAMPLVAGQATMPLLRRTLTAWRVLLVAGFAFFAIVGIQPLLWYLQTGHWLAYGYAGEGFHWDRPEVFKVLFGFRRGLFLWTPVMLLAAWGSLALWRSDRWRSAWSLAYWAVSTYIISSWWIWYYGGGFASRVYIDHYPVMVLPLALFLHHLLPGRWSAARVFMALCVCLNLAQLWQYQNGFLHHESMDRSKYAYAFLRFDAAHQDRLGGNYQAPPFHPNGMDVVLTESCDLDNPCRFWERGIRVPWEHACAGPNVCVFAPGIEFGTMFRAGTDVLPTGRALYLEVGLQRFEATKEASLHALGITQVRNASGSTVYYEGFRMNPLPGTPGKWEHLEYRIPVPPLEPGDELTFFLWNEHQSSSFLIDALFMRVHAVRPY